MLRICICTVLAMHTVWRELSKTGRAEAAEATQMSRMGRGHQARCRELGFQDSRICVHIRFMGRVLPE
jgi:hypothetical protein